MSLNNNKPPFPWNKTFPYPVLGSFDDILPAPDMPVVKLEADKNYYHFNIDLAFNNPEIRQIVEEDYADYVCEVSCRATRFRACLQSKEPHFELHIPRRGVAGKIYIACTITVKKAIANYTNMGFHPDYYGHSFDMEPGDLLGILAMLEYYADIKYDKLKAVGTFMEIVPTEDEWPTTILGKDKIELRMPRNLYDQYKDNPAVNSKADILHASVVLNALTYALCRIEQYADKKWAETIDYRIKAEPELAEFRDQSPEDWRVDKLSHILLGKPYERMFNYLIKNDVNTE